MAKVKKGRDSAALTSAEQIAVMERLSQPAAAWLVGVSARTLRDHAIPRAEDNRYNAGELLTWAAGRIPAPEMLTDDEWERLLTIGELYVAETGLAVGPIADFLTELRDKYGDAGLAAFARGLLEYCESEADAGPERYREPTPGELRAEVERRLQEEQRHRAFDRLDIAVVCEGCGRLRRGRRWVKQQPARGFAVVKDACPSCDGRQ